MAINKAMLAALKALSYPSDIDLAKTYKLERQIDSLKGKAHKISPYYRSWDHKVWNGGHEIPVRIFTSPASASDKVLLFFHGGGWVKGTIDSYDKVCFNMSRFTGHTVVSVDYRLAPEHRFPQGLEDCYAAAKEVFLHKKLLRAAAEDIILIGDSAGGNLAAAVSLLAKERGEFMPARQILIYPATGNNHTDSSPFASVLENGKDYLLTSKRVCEYMDFYVSSPEDYQNPLLAPLLAEDLTGQPKTLIVTAEFCPLRDEGEAYGEKLRSFGCDVEIHRIADALHGFLSLPPRFPQVKEVYEIINHFLNENCKCKLNTSAKSFNRVRL